MEINITYPTDIFISRLILGHHLDLQKEISQALPPPRRIAIITDDTMASYLPQLGFTRDIFCFAAGESHKTRTTKENLEDALLQAGFGRDTVIVGLGGGVTTDLAGFVAATFCRGVPFIAVPTTLMGMVDASIGGKTGVNTPLAKNMIGAFHPPVCVCIDTSFLATLSHAQLQEGLSEIVKHALIASLPLFTLLLDNYHAWICKDPCFFHHLIYQSCEIKAAIVEKDPFEKGIRRILNFGHTIAHALEATLGYRMSHGKAVAIGILLESHLSYQMGILSREDLEKIEHLYALYQLPSSLPEGCPIPAFLSSLGLDKKNIQGRIRTVTLDTIGRASSHNGEYCTFIEREKFHTLFTHLTYMER